MKIEGKSEGILLPRDCNFSADGKHLQGITRAVVEFKPGEPVVVAMELCMHELSIIGMLPTFKCTHPETGEFKEVLAIEFGDGERWEADDV